MADKLNDLLSPLLHEYHKRFDIRQVPIKVDHLRPLIQERGVVDRIIWEAVEYEGSVLIAKVEFYKAEMGVYAGKGNYARIQYSNSLNFCWRRFAIAKEMFHCLLDKTPDKRVTTAEDVLKLGHLLISDSYAAIEESKPLDTERFAELLALETLFPMELRCRHKQAYENGEITDHQLALRYRIPEFYVGIAMSNGYYKSIYDRRVADFVEL